jgi:hypothetical protein
MSEVVAGLDCASFRRHALHDLERDWPETNCYVDLWIEFLSARGQEPLAGLGFTCLIDFEGDQFTFFKPPAQDLKLLYGADILELAIYDDVVVHCAEQVARGRMPMIELDAYYMPDTKGLTYRAEHSKTTIGINAIDGEARRVAYFHNAGYFVAEGEDFDGLFSRLPQQQGRADALFPYCEFVKLSAAPCSAGVPALARALLDGHLARARTRCEPSPRASLSTPASSRRGPKPSFTSTPSTCCVSSAPISSCSRAISTGLPRTSSSMRHRRCFTHARSARPRKPASSSSPAPSCAASQ